MVANYCIKSDVLDFYKVVYEYLFCDANKDDVLNSFLDEIDSNIDNANAFLSSLMKIDKYLKEDLAFFLVCDPACNGKEEVIECYPGYKAIVCYRIANILFNLNYKVEARVISEHAHFLTGIDIHPGARIASPFFIDHGTGIVIGETSIIGHHVRMYQGVTLGALSLAKGALIKGEKRHPTIGNNVTIYANASILGGDVTIGDNVVIGGNVFLLESIPSNYKVIINKPKLILIKK